MSSAGFHKPVIALQYGKKSPPMKEGTKPFVEKEEEKRQQVLKL